MKRKLVIYKCTCYLIAGGHLLLIPIPLKFLSSLNCSMVRKSIRTLPSLDRPFTPASALKRNSSAVRSPRIQTMPGGFFRIRNKLSRKYLMTLQYAKVVTNQKKAEAFDKKSRYLSPKVRRKQGKLSRIIIRTHNKEYSQRITEQDSLRRVNDKQCKKIRWQVLKWIRGKRVVGVENFSELNKSIKEWGETATKFLPKEKWFVSKGANNVARKLSIKRIGFIQNNVEEIQYFVSMLVKKNLLGEYHALILLQNLESVSSMLEQYKKYLPSEQKIFGDLRFN